MVETQQIIDAVEDGNRVRPDIAEACGVHENHIGKDLRDLVEQGVLYREKDGYTYHYYVAQAELAAAEEAAEERDPSPPSVDGEAARAANRDYNWSDKVPSSDEAHEYVPTDGEWDKIEAIFRARHEMGTLPRFLISGPSGNGKTTLAEWFATKHEMPYFEVSMSNAIYEADLLGSARMTASGEVWEDGEITKAIQSSADRPTVLVIDEGNRATPDVLNVLFSVLDHRCRVQLPPTAPGDGEIVGCAEDLIVFMTINEGREYTGAQQDMDHALKRRMKLQFDTDYLGMNHAAREAELVVGRTPAHEGLAELMVEGANDVRTMAKKDDRDIRVNRAIPTAALLDWAGFAYGYANAGMDDPVDEAARDIARLYYSDEQERDEVIELLLAPLGGAPFDESEFKAWAGDLGDRLRCPECGWSAYEDEAPPAAVDLFDCPECESDEGVLEWDRD